MSSSVSSLPGIGPANTTYLNASGYYTVNDLLQGCQQYGMDPSKCINWLLSIGVSRSDYATNCFYGLQQYSNANVRTPSVQVPANYTVTNLSKPTPKVNHTRIANDNLQKNVPESNILAEITQLKNHQTEMVNKLQQDISDIKKEKQEEINRNKANQLTALSDLARIQNDLSDFRNIQNSTINQLKEECQAIKTDNSTLEEINKINKKVTVLEKSKSDVDRKVSVLYNKENEHEDLKKMVVEIQEYSTKTIEELKSNTSQFTYEINELTRIFSELQEKQTDFEILFEKLNLKFENQMETTGDHIDKLKLELSNIKEIIQQNDQLLNDKITSIFYKGCIGIAFIIIGVKTYSYLKR